MRPQGARETVYSTSGLVGVASVVHHGGRSPRKWRLKARPPNGRETRPPEDKAPGSLGLSDPGKPLKSEGHFLTADYATGRGHAGPAGLWPPVVARWPRSRGHDFGPRIGAWGLVARDHDSGPPLGRTLSWSNFDHETWAKF